MIVHGLFKPCFDHYFILFPQKCWFTKLKKIGHSHDPDLKDGILALVISNSSDLCYKPPVSTTLVGLWKSEKKCCLVLDVISLVRSFHDPP